MLEHSFVYEVLGLAAWLHVELERVAHHPQPSYWIRLVPACAYLLAALNYFGESALVLRDHHVAPPPAAIEERFEHPQLNAFESLAFAIPEEAWPDRRFL